MSRVWTASPGPKLDDQSSAYQGFTGENKNTPKALNNRAAVATVALDSVGKVLRVAAVPTCSPRRQAADRSSREQRPVQALCMK